MIFDSVLLSKEVEQLYLEGLSKKAFNPSPSNQAADVNIDTELGWTAGERSETHDVYLGTDYNDVKDANTSSPEFMGNYDVNSYDPCGFEYYTNYYWRIDEKNFVGTTKSNVWSFTTVAPPAVSIIGSWETGTTHTEESGTNRALVFIAHVEDDDYPTINLTSASYGGQAMTKVVEEVVSTGWWWYQIRAYVVAYILDEEGIDAADGGSFSVSWNQAAPDYVAYSSVFLEDVNQTVLTGASASNTSTSGATIATSALTTNDGDMVIAAATCGNSGSYTLNNGFTEGTDQTMGNTAAGATGYKSATGADETPSVTHSNPNRQVIIGLVVQSSM